MQTEEIALASTLALVLLAASVAVVGAAAASSHDGVNTTVSFEDQVSDGDSVVVQESAHHEDYVVVVHADDDGPGAILGHAAADNGSNEDLEVDLDDSLDEGNHTLHAMLHATANESEYGSPLSVDEEIVVDDGVVTVEAAETNETDDAMDDEMDGNETEDDDLDEEMDDNMTDDEDGNESDDGEEDGEGLPGFTAVAALLAVVSLAFLARRS